MDNRIQAVLDVYHDRINEERTQPRTEPPGGRDGGQDMRMRAVGPKTGELLNILARSLEAPRILEIGTSFGYSGIWLGEAATEAGLADYIDFQVGDAVALIEQLQGGVDFVLLDLWKDLYVPCLEAFYPKLNQGAIVVADNMIRPANTGVEAYARAIRAKPGISSVMLPVGSGLEISRLATAGE